MAVVILVRYVNSEVTLILGFKDTLYAVGQNTCLEDENGFFLMLGAGGKGFEGSRL